MKNLQDEEALKLQKAYPAGTLEDWVELYKAFPSEPLIRAYALKAFKHYAPALAALIKDE